MNRKIIIAGFLAFIIFQSFSQPNGYNISIGIADYQDTALYLGHYYGDKLSVADTSIVNKGQFVFKGNEALKQGVYFVVSMDKRKLFEFLVDEDQDFSLSSSMRSDPGGMTVKGSDENKLFYAYLVYNKKSFERMKSIQKRMQTLEEGSDSITYYKEQLERMNEASINYKLRLMDENPGSMIALLFELMKDPEIPENFIKDGRHDTIGAYLYYRNHYWDGIDLSDDRILRTPVFFRKLDNYMNNVIPKHPDSVIVEIDKMITATNGNTEMKDYLLWHFTNAYETSKVMGYDKIFVHMVDAYFTTESYDWLNPEVQQNMIKRANTLRQVLIGAYAPPLIMSDTSGSFIAMRQIEAEYLIILFWVTHCGECQQEVSELKRFYAETDMDIEIYGINTDTSMSAWKSYINRKGLEWIHVNGNMSLTGDYHDLYDIYSTPVIYLLDREKKIIGKRILASQVPDFLRRHREMKQGLN